MKNAIPNIFTILNLLSGFLGITFLLNSNYNLIEYCIYFSILFDFLDGFLAKRLNAISNLGKQLDSFSDLISFGALPSLILYNWFLNHSSIEIYKYFSVIILVFSSLRLSKFNLDKKQEFVFYGLPTPMVALFFNSLIFNSDDIYSFVNQEILLFLILFFSFMMIVKVKFISLKFKNYSLKENIDKYILLFVSIILFSTLRFQSFPIIVVIYIIISFYFSRFNIRIIK